MNLKPIIEKAIIRNEALADDERVFLLDWFTRAEGMAGSANLVTGQLTVPIGPTQTEINVMVDQALRGRQVVNNLSEISSQTGLQIAGEFRVGNGKLPGDGFTGGRYGWPGFDYGGGTYFLAGVNNDVLQVGLSLTDGKVYAGAGGVVLDAGGITAVAGTIGGWTISVDYIQDAAGVVGMSSAVGGGDDVRFWAGDISQSTAPFRVHESGFLHAENVDITGEIHATGGTIGGFTIDQFTISAVEDDLGIVLDTFNTAMIRVGNMAGNYIEINGFEEWIRSSNFVAGATGFNIATDTGDAEFNNITARGELKTFLLTSSNQMAVAGNIIVSKDAGKLGADVSSGATTVNFGKALTVGNWIKIQGPDSAGSNALEWMLIGSLVSGTTYNVTRNVDGSGANAWLKDTPFVVIGANGDSRIELVAGASGSIQLITQGATWNTQTVQASMSTVAGAITAGGGNVVIDQYGIYIANNQQGSFGFKDTSGNRDNLFIYSDNADGIGIINRLAGKAILQTIKLTDTSTPSLRWREHPSTANLSQFQINTGTSATQVEIGNDIILAANRDGSATVFNELSNDIDFRIESATNASFFVIDAGAETLTVNGAMSFDGAVVINESGANKDTRIESDTNADFFVIDADAELLTVDGAVEFNVSNGNRDFAVHGDTLDYVLAVDASADRVGIGTNAPGSKLDVNGSFQCDSITNDTGLAAGTYAPTCTAVANVDSTSAVTDFTYMRVGNSVLVSGNMNIDATVITTLTRVRVSLPIASDLTNAGDLTGTGGIQGSDDVVIAIGDVTNNAAEINYTANGTANTVIRILFMYVVK
jgi:hypothetical protein